MSGQSLEVVILNDHASLTGGSAAVAVASALGLAAREVPVTLMTAVGPVAPQLRGVTNLEVICLGQREIARDGNRLRAFVSGWRNTRAVAALRELLARKSPASTVVHVHSWTKALSPFVFDAAAAMGFPVVVTLHDFFIVCPNGGFFVYPKGELCRRKPLSASCWSCNCDRRSFGHKLWRNARTTMQNRMLKVPERAAYCIGVSDFSLRIMRPYLPAAVPCRVVRNPVDCVKMDPAPVANNRDFLFIGRFEQEKGVRLFAEAAQASGVAATFVGDGALAADVRKICPRARFTGWLDAPDIRQLLRTARALVFPPLWYETLGLVVIEAAAMGVPAIIADGCAATEYIGDRVNGLHFVHGSAEALRARMLELENNTGLAVRLGRAAYDWYWRNPWTADRHVSELLEIYGSLTGSAGVKSLAGLCA